MRLRAPLEEVELVVVGQQLFNIYLLVAVPKELKYAVVAVAGFCVDVVRGDVQKSGIFS